MLKKFLAFKVAKVVGAYFLRKEIKIIAGTLLTIGTHKLIQKAAKTYPSLSFLKTTR